jgi:hypothetical protein
MAASKQGFFVVSGSAYTASGRGASFTAILDKAGRLVRIIQNGRFAKLRLAFAEDDMLWAAGRLITYPSLEDPPEHAMLRAFDLQGRQRISLLDASSFPKEQGRSHPARISRLASNGRLLAFLSPEYNTLAGGSALGKILFRSGFEPPASEYSVTGFAVSPSGEIYMSCQIPESPKSKAKNVFAFYRWNSATAAWETVLARKAADGLGGPHALFGIGPKGMLVSDDRLHRFSWRSLQESTGTRGR